MLWERSLVMMDTQTRSLWSHLLGEAMAGPMKGSQLEALPSKLTTWKAWREEHPQTTLLDMSRTHRAFVKDFYRRPQDFVYGLVVDGTAHHASFADLRKQPVLNVELENSPLLITFDADNAAGYVFSRTVDERTLTFASAGKEMLRDDETGTTWSAITGKGVSGPLADKRLDHRVGITSFARAWNVFHPTSRPIRPTARQTSTP